MGDPPRANASFVAAIQDVMQVCQRPNDPACPVVGLDETSKQLIMRRACQLRRSQVVLPGTTMCTREMHRPLLMLFGQLEGWPHVKVTERHCGFRWIVNTDSV